MLPGGTPPVSTLFQLAPSTLVQNLAACTRARGALRRSSARSAGEAGLEEDGAVRMDLGGTGLFELLPAERPAGEDGYGPDTGGARRLDVPDGVPHGHSLVRRGAGLLQGQLEYVG